MLFVPSDECGLINHINHSLKKGIYVNLSVNFKSFIWNYFHF